jgi:hypothetical protein
MNSETQHSRCLWSYIYMLDRSILHVFFVDEAKKLIINFLAICLQTLILITSQQTIDKKVFPKTLSRWYWHPTADSWYFNFVQNRAKVKFKMKKVEKVVKFLTVVICLVSFFLLAMDVIVKFQKKLTTTGIQFQDNSEERKLTIKLAEVEVQKPWQLGYTVTSRKPYWRGRLHTVDLLVLTGLDQLLFILEMLFSLFYKTMHLNEELSPSVGIPYWDHKLKINTIYQTSKCSCK